ncbi:4Fe-4S binding protein [Pseudomonas shahriarae]
MAGKPAPTFVSGYVAITSGSRFACSHICYLGAAQDWARAWLRRAFTWS